MLFCEPRPVLVARGKGWEEKPLVGCCLLRAYLLGERRPLPRSNQNSLRLMSKIPEVKLGSGRGDFLEEESCWEHLDLAWPRAGSRTGSSESGGQVWVLVAGGKLGKEAALNCLLPWD